MLRFTLHEKGMSHDRRLEERLAKLHNQELYKSLDVSDNFVGDNYDLPISNKCRVVGCHKKIIDCDSTGLTCQCCEMISCIPNWPVEDTLINGRPKSFRSPEDRNIVLLSRVSEMFS